MIPCGCGCGELIPEINKRGEPARYKHGHNTCMEVGLREQPVVGYRAMHQRLERRRGQARDFDCTRCERRARTWALNHEAPVENLRVDTHTTMEGLVFSIEPDDYRPLCQSCNALEGSPTNCGMAWRLFEMGRTSQIPSRAQAA